MSEFLKINADKFGQTVDALSTDWERDLGEARRYLNSFQKRDADPKNELNRETSKLVKRGLKQMINDFEVMVFQIGEARTARALGLDKSYREGTHVDAASGLRFVPNATDRWMVTQICDTVNQLTTLRKELLDPRDKIWDEAAIAGVDSRLKPVIEQFRNRFLAARANPERHQVEMPLQLEATHTRPGRGSTMAKPADSLPSAPIPLNPPLARRE